MNERDRSSHMLKPEHIVIDHKQGTITIDGRTLVDRGTIIDDFDGYFAPSVPEGGVTWTKEGYAELHLMPLTLSANRITVIPRV